MKLYIVRAFSKHEAVKQSESLENRIEHRRIERLRQTLALKINRRSQASTSQAA
jgi:hypothetical protein